MAIVATTLRKGQAIKFQGETGIVLNIEHRTPGKGNALIMATVRSFQSGKTKDIRFASDDKVEIAQVQRDKLEFSYADQTGYHFMNAETYEMVDLPEELIGEAKDWLTENMEVEAIYCDGKAVAVELPGSVEVKVVSAPEGVKGDTATNAQKPATLESGKTIQVPLFVKDGDVIKVDTRTGKYAGRA